MGKMSEVSLSMSKVKVVVKNTKDAFMKAFCDTFINDERNSLKESNEIKIEGSIIKVHDRTLEIKIERESKIEHEKTKEEVLQNRVKIMNEVLEEKFGDRFIRKDISSYNNIDYLKTTFIDIIRTYGNSLEKCEDRITFVRMKEEKCCDFCEKSIPIKDTEVQDIKYTLIHDKEGYTDLLSTLSQLGKEIPFFKFVFSEEIVRDNVSEESGNFKVFYGDWIRESAREKGQLCNHCQSTTSIASEFKPHDTLLNNMIVSHGLDAYSVEGISSYDIMRHATLIHDFGHKMELCCSHKSQPVGSIGLYLNGEPIIVANRDLSSFETTLGYRLIPNEKLGDKDSLNKDGMLDKPIPCSSKEELLKAMSKTNYENTTTEIIEKNFNIKGVWVKEQGIANAELEKQDLLKVAEDIAEMFGVKLFKLKD